MPGVLRAFRAFSLSVHIVSDGIQLAERLGHIHRVNSARCQCQGLSVVLGPPAGEAWHQAEDWENNISCLR